MYPKIKSKNIDPYFWTTPPCFFIWIEIKRVAPIFAPSPRALEKVFAFQVLRTKTTPTSLFKKMIFGLGFGVVKIIFLNGKRF